MELKSPRVSVGWASKLGWAGTVGALAVAVSEGVDTTHGWKYAALGVLTLVVTNLGRQLQAHGLAPKAGSAPAQAIDDASKALVALTAEAHANAATLPADGVDSASVPFSGA